MNTPATYRLPESLPADLREFRRMTEQFRAGAIPAARYQAFRVPQGVYEQRKSGSYMLRARLVAGVATPQQLRAVAEVGERYGSGLLHLTSRQDLQVHDVPAENLADALERLAQAGLSTKGGGGNTVRNIATCFQAGVCPEEAADVTPLAIELTEALLADPLSFQLPRKYKIACSGCGRDCAGATLSDLGFISRRRDGEDGFAVYVGGGLGAHSRVGRLLEEFAPASEATRIAEAIKRVFDRHGNRKNRHRARLRFLVEDLGFEAFERLYRAELGEIARKPLPAAGAGTGSYPSAQILAQKQPGKFSMEIAPPLGVIHAAEMRRLADVVERRGDGRLRATSRQTAVLRYVPAEELAQTAAELAAIGLWREEPPILRHMVTCAGASTCRLGICLSRGLAEALRAAIAAGGLRLDGPTGALTIHISGCPNACGHHPVASIGLSGAARRIGGHIVPHYVAQFGGRVGEGSTRLASGDIAIPARNVPAFLVEWLRAFEGSAQYPDFEAFFEREGEATGKALAAVYGRVPDIDVAPEFYVDWGAEEPFSLAGRGPGECGAGVFDLIALDLTAAADAMLAGNRFAAVAAAARALLVTRGEQSTGDRQSLELFERLFVKDGLVAADFAPLIEEARRAAAEPDPEGVFGGDTAQVEQLLTAVRALYQAMGPSLRLPQRGAVS
jgi:sulfite reductase (ferredoxin)